MATGRRLGLDEVMIVNPASSGDEMFFLGQDGTLYRMEPLLGDGGADDGALEVGQLYLSDDGILYKVID
jgi:hypothetical protein